MDLSAAIQWFQTKIGTYDKANWEITVEKQEIENILTDCLSNANLPKDLLDIDLIRGSTFTKAKPSYHWTQVTATGLFKVLFFPLYFRWWRQQTSFGVWLFFVLLYFMQLVALVVYATHQHDQTFSNISVPEAVVPFLAMFLLGELYIHVVSTNFTKPISRKIKKMNSEKSSVTDKTKTRKRRRRKRDKENQHQDGESRDASAERVIDRVECLRTAETTMESNECTEEEFTTQGMSETEVDSSFGLRKRFMRKISGTTSPPLAPSINLSTEAAQPNRGESRDETTSNQSESESESSDSSESISEGEAAEEQADVETQNLLFPNGVDSNTLCNIRHSNDLITVSIWDGDSFKKAKMNFFEIGNHVIRKVECQDNTSDYLSFSIMASVLLGLLPMFFRIYQFHVVNKEMPFKGALTQLALSMKTYDGVVRIYRQLFGASWRPQLVVLIAMVSRVTLSFSTFFLLCVAESAYKVRYKYAKLFGMITSTRRSRRNRLPHFRLHKVKNIKAWLSLRSFLKKRGPQRSVDTIVSTAFMASLLLIVLTCIQFISVSGKEERFIAYFFSWELSAWCLVLGIFLIRFIGLGSDINRKYKNTSILLTEQINLYLQMEKDPKKKEELLIANNVLKLASKLLKELEGPFKVSGFIMNPLLSNITRVMVLSLFSGVMSDILGFRLRLWKIKA